MSQDSEYRKALVRELLALPRETEWLELKHNNDDPKQIGEYLSALSNAAALHGKAFAYLMWGIENESHRVVGTRFVPQATKVGNEELESWLLRQLEPKINFRFHEVQLDDLRVVLLEIERATRHPVQFSGQEFLRIGSYTKKLKAFPEKERALWRIFDATPFERLPAAERLSADEVLRLIDYPAYFDLMGRPLPEERAGILQALQADELIVADDGGRWSVRNLGAILFARRLADFSGLRRKAVRVIAYKGGSRVETVREQEGTRGYAAGFEGLIGYVNGLLPSNEIIGPALRKAVLVYPELAIRELIVNALIHQDFFMTGSGPMVEIFSDRMEITNPGKPLVDVNRFLDLPPRSRNEALASMMRRIGICEERGSGVDKVVSQCELYQLPAPAFEVPGDSTRSVLFALRPLHLMDKADRLRAVYLHACLRYVQRQTMTNASLRERFGIDPKNSAIASRLLKEALDDGSIRLADEQAPPKLRKYLPGWA